MSTLWETRPFLHGSWQPFNLAMISSLTQGECTFVASGHCKKKSIPCAFCVHPRVRSHGNAGGKGIGMRFKAGSPNHWRYMELYLFFFFFKANGDFSVSSPRSVLPVSVPAAAKQQMKRAALLPREGTTRQLEKGTEASRLYLRHYIFMSWCSITVISNNHISNRSFPYLPSPLQRMESVSLKPLLSS